MFKSNNLSLLQKNAKFRYLYFGQFVSFLGTMFTSVALPYQIYHQTHSTLMVGLLGSVQLIPLLFTALIGGVLADRHHRVKLLWISIASMALGSLTLAWNAHLPHPSIPLLFLVSATMSALNGISRPAYGGLLQQLVNKKDFGTASALASITYSFGGIAGPAIGGIVIAHFGLVSNYIIDFSSFLFALITLALVGQVSQPLLNKEQSAWDAFKEGLKFAGSRQELLGSYFVDFSAMIFGMPNALFPAISQSYGGVKVLGLFYAAPAVGALLVSLVTFWHKHIKRHGVVIAVTASLWGVAIIFFGLTNNLWLALFFLMLAGGFDGISAIFRNILWNESVPNALRGRLVGLEMISYLSGPKLGDTEAGLVAAAFGVTASVISGGVLCIVGVAVCCYYFPRFWKYKTK